MYYLNSIMVVYNTSNQYNYTVCLRESEKKMKKVKKS